MLSALVQAGHTVRGGVIADYLRDKIHLSFQFVLCDFSRDIQSFLKVMSCLRFVNRLHGVWRALEISLKDSNDPKLILLCEC